MERTAVEAEIKRDQDAGDELAVSVPLYVNLPTLTLALIERAQRQEEAA